MDHLLHKLEMFDVGIAKPVSTSPVHLIAYRPFPENSDRFEACPVVLTVSSRNRIHLKKEDAAIPNLLLTFVWFATEKTDPEIYALPFVELKQVFDDRGYTRNPAWHDNGFWTIPHPDTGLKDFMQLHRITSGAEWEREVQAALRKV